MDYHGLSPFSVNFPAVASPGVKSRCLSWFRRFQSQLRHQVSLSFQLSLPIGSMYAIYGNIYHQYTPNVSMYTIHGFYGIGQVNMFIVR